jgi:hypothetical protein
MQFTADTLDSFVLVHLRAAQKAAKRCQALEEQHQDEPLGAFIDDIRIEVVTSVLAAVAATEVNVNQYFFEASGRHKYFDKLSQGQAQAIQKLIDRENILEKYGYLAKFSNSDDIKCLNKGQEPHQFMKALIDVRNAFVHFKPEWHSGQRKHKNLGKQLDGKFAFSRFFSENDPIFPRRCMSASMAQWAFDSAFTFMTDFAQETGLPNRFAKFFDDTPSTE